MRYEFAPDECGCPPDAREVIDDWKPLEGQDGIYRRLRCRRCGQGSTEGASPDEIPE